LIEKVMKEITEIISPVYLVGGAVRDYIMDKEVDDYDFTTPYTPDEVEAILLEKNPDRKIWTSGKRFGTIATKLYISDPICSKFPKVEITTFREEVYEGSRKPKVEFVRSLEQDLMRRDFTMNAIALRMKKNHFHVIDPFNGMDDIENGIVRAVGSPRQRFKEDPLRMLRAARFMSTLGFSIEENTGKRILDGAPQILKVSKERWTQELDKLLMGDYVVNGLNALMAWRLMNYMIPELSIQFEYDQMTPYHDFNLWEHTVRVVEAVPKDINMKWAALLHDVGKPYVAKIKPNGEQKTYVGHELVGAELAEKIGRYLKWSKDRIDTVSDTVGCHLEDRSPLKGYDSGAQKRKEGES
jgi:putative nucleotidyltransferase with HDIG domain